MQFCYKTDLCDFSDINRNLITELPWCKAYHELDI